MEKKIIQFDNEFSDIENQQVHLSDKIKNRAIEIDKDNSELKNIMQEVNSLIEQCNIPIDKVPTYQKNKINLDELCDSIYADFDKLHETALQKSIKDANRFPELSKQDYIVCFVIGLAAALIDIFLVGVPQRVKLSTGKEVIEGSYLTEMLRKLGSDENGIIYEFYKSLESRVKVPYDIVDMKNGIMPKDHRLKSLGHDPLFGLIFAVFDLVNGTATMVNKGILKIYTRESMSIESRFTIVLYYLGHLTSDIFTSMGIPVPGAFLTQFFNIDIDDINIADISKKMYINGYDLRHLASMTSSVVFQKIVLNLYFKLLEEEIKSELKAIQETEMVQIKSKKQKMLFIISSIATTGNVIKFICSNFSFEALNMPQLLDFVSEAIKFTSFATRDMTYEKLALNRKKIGETWSEILDV